MQAKLSSLALVLIVVFHNQVLADSPKGYKLTLENEGRTLVIDGCLDIGVTREVEDLFIEHEFITRVELNSKGGNIYQGRGLARVFRENEAETHVAQECSSACVTAFIAGK